MTNPCLKAGEQGVSVDVSLCPQARMPLRRDTRCVIRDAKHTHTHTDTHTHLRYLLKYCSL